MSDRAALAAFVDKWRARWPEWRIAEAFVPAGERAATVAWLALRQELADAAWGGADPRPGAAKLAWWNDELCGWAQGRRRHPLGLALQRHPAPWAALAATLPALEAARDASLRGAAVASLQPTLAPFAVAAAAVSAALAAAPGDIAAPPTAEAHGSALAASLSALRALARDGDAAAAQGLLDAWPSRPPGTRADRTFAALAHGRLQALADGRRNRAPSPWHTLWAVWRAGRSIPPA